jgi:glucose/arabinose dehydrogenase
LLLVLILIAAAVGVGQLRTQVNLAGILARGESAEISVPPGFVVNIYAEGLSQPRFMQFSPDGILFVAERGENRILALRDQDRDGRSDEATVFADDLDRPHSLVYQDDVWYVGVPSGVVRLRDSDGDGMADERQILIDDYPTGGHTTRTVEFLPDGRMVVSIGSSCNVCEEQDTRRAAIVIYDDEEENLYATGLRNAVGLAIHPLSGQLWATNNGRDFMGDDLPPETVYALEEGEHYGWPTCHNGTIEDPDHGFSGACEGIPTPSVEMQAHSAPLGLVFYTGDSFPADYLGDLLVAFHGSWNRSVPTGYKVVRIRLKGSEVVGSVEDFATGWLDEQSEHVSGRPVGLAIGPDGALYVSDDTGGFIYRIQYQG